MDVKELLVKGLCSTPKYIDMSCRYDKQGSIYDDQCQDIEDFYHYKAEEAIMRCNAKKGGYHGCLCTCNTFEAGKVRDVAIAHLPLLVSENVTYDAALQLKTPLRLFDLGCGSTTKSQYLINELLANKHACETLKNIYGNRLKVDPIAGDFMNVIPQIGKYRGRKVLLWLSGLQCFPLDTQHQLLSKISESMEGDDSLLMTADITQDKAVIEKAYLDFDDSKPFAKLYTNGVHVANRELGEEVGKNVTFEEGEKLHLYSGNGISHKYTIPQPLITTFIYQLLVQN
uniref:Histidine-specific methyltransferase SAM-dependent domain-containing protein n=1 Tax=Magallana gigas TaxID=29159 RepID=K1PCY1_MAGGI